MDKLHENLIQLKDEWEKFKSNPDNRKIRIRDAAFKLGVSEAELLSAEIDNESTFYLKVDSALIFLKSLLDIDRIMLLIRNDYVVHEKTVDCQDIDFDIDFIYFKNKNKDILLKFTIESISHIFFQKKMHAGKELRSFQLFNDNGNSILKIYLKGKSKNRFDKIANDYKAEYKYELQQLEGRVSNSNIKVKIPLINDSSYSKEAVRLEGSILRRLLNKASDDKSPMQIHAIGLNSIQYHRDIVKNIVDYGPWINVIDKNFNVHILENELSQCILFKYNQNNKEIYSIEFFDSNSNHLLGICSLNDYELEFNHMLNELGVL